MVFVPLIPFDASLRPVLSVDLCGFTLFGLNAAGAGAALFNMRRGLKPPKLTFS